MNSARSTPSAPAAARDWPPGLPLETERLILRPFRESDFADVHEYASDPEVTRHLRWGPSAAPETLSFLRQAIAGVRTAGASQFHLAVVERKSARVRGGLSLLERAPGLVEIGYCFARPVWGLGYATEAVRSAARFAGVRFPGADLFGLVTPGNPASERVLLRAGFAPALDASPYAAWMTGVCSTARVFRQRCRPA